jgi:hypothetical protein
MKTIISLVLIALSALVFSSNSSGATVSFLDTIKYWGDGAGWGASQAWNTDIANGPWDGNAIDVIGDPNITGGTADFNGAGKLMSVTFDYYTPYNDWRMLAPGNLFINVLNSANDTTWDYVVTTMGDPTKNTTQPDGSITTLDPGFYNIFNISSLNIDAKRGSNDSAYIVSGPDNTGVWSGWYLRNNHPIGIQQSVLNSSPVGQADYSGFPGLTAPINGILQGSSTYDFSSIGGLDLGDKNIIVGWEMTCANDVIYEQVNNPAPEPSTFILLGAGLLGAVLARRKFRTRA